MEKRILIILFLSCSCLFAQNRRAGFFPQVASSGGGGGNNVALVGANSGGTVSPSSQANLTYNLGGATVTSGNSVIVGVALAGTGLNNFAAGQLTKTAGTATIGTIALDSAKNQGAGDIACAIYRVPITGNGTITLQYANGVNAFIIIGEGEFTGLNASPVGTSGSNGGTSATESSGSVTTGANGMIFYIATEDSTITWTRTFSDTLIFNQHDGNANFTGLVQFKIINASPNTLTSTTESSSIAWVVAYQAYITN